MEIWLIHTDNLSARIIHIGMWLFDVLRFKKPLKPIYNHALIFDNHANVIYEADYPRVVMLPLHVWFNKDKNKNVKIKKIPLKLTRYQRSKFRRYLNSQVGKRYELANFWWHLVKIFTNKWFGKTNDNQHYCYELVIHCVNQIVKNKINPYLNPSEFYRKYYQNI